MDDNGAANNGDLSSSTEAPTDFGSDIVANRDDETVPIDPIT
jgi:hypothetical protein